MKRICVFCGSSPGASPEYLQAATQLGYTLAGKNIGLVYGGAKVGMMGRIAEAVLEKKGEVIGVIPKGLAEKEVSFTGLADLRVVDSMHERKAIMAELADGFIALPGGLGTPKNFERWRLTRTHPKPTTKLMDFWITWSGKFVELEHRSMILIDEDPDIN
jgi:uncharacterized protein (TIGR00730 family)